MVLSSRHVPSLVGPSACWLLLAPKSYNETRLIRKQALIFKASTIILIIPARLAFDNPSIQYSIGDCYFLGGKARSRSFLESLSEYIYISRRSFWQILNLIYSRCHTTLLYLAIDEQYLMCIVASRRRIVCGSLCNLY